MIHRIKSEIQFLSKIIKVRLAYILVGFEWCKIMILNGQTLIYIAYGSSF